MNIQRQSNWSGLLAALCFGSVLALSLPASAKDKPRRPALEGYLRNLGYGVVKLKFDQRRLMSAPASIQGKSLTLGIFTPNPITSLDGNRNWGLELLAAKGLILDDIVTGPIVGDRLVLIPELVLDGSRFSRQPADLGTFINYPHPGIIGVDFLQRHYAILDCLDGRLYVRAKPPGDTVQESLDGVLRKNGFQDVPLQRTKYLLMVAEVEVDGNKLPMLINTGWPTTQVEREVAGTTSRRRYETQENLPPPVAAKVTLKLSGRTLPHRGVEMQPGPLTKLLPCEVPIKGSLGMDALSSGQVLLDVGKSRLWFVPEDVVKAVEKAKRTK